MAIRVDKLASEVNRILEEYVDATDEVVKAAADKVAKEAVRELRESPDTPRRTGDYARGWTQKVTANRGRLYNRTVYNAKHYRLTHLLEYGHALRQGGRARAYPHIAPVEAKAVADFERLVTGGIEKI